MQVLEILMRHRLGLAGSLIATMSGLASGTLYPIFTRLEEAGWIKSQVRDDSNPRRKIYSLTTVGARGAREEAMKWQTVVGGLLASMPR
jgi:DNA-binding PadR family transcriptional regulator